jgi:hypothetical protein
MKLASSEVDAPPANRTRLHPGWLVVLAAPLLWVVVAILHPDDTGKLYEGISDEANRWIFVHAAQLFLTPFLAAGVWMLLLGIHSVAANVARAVLAIWMVFFSAFDAAAGIATGVMTRHANSLGGEERAGVAAAVDFLFHDSQLAGGEFSVLGNIGQGSWIVLVIVTAVALYRAGAPRVLVAATLVSVLFGAHSGYAAAAGLIALFVAELLRFMGSRGEAVARISPEPT